jgi:D-lactate dehydrogenase (cytochrome)
LEREIPRWPGALAYVPSLLGEEFGDAAVDLMRRLKTAWDPLNILNPGKVVTTT